MEGGQTVHRGFGLPIPMYNDSISKLKPGMPLANVLRDSHVILINEVSIMSTHGLRIMNKILREQLLPVVPRGTRTEIVSECVISNALWGTCHPVILKENVRAQFDPDFTARLLKVGTGHVPLAKGVTNPNIIEIPPEMLLKIPKEKISKSKSNNQN